MRLCPVAHVVALWRSHKMMDIIWNKLSLKFGSTLNEFVERHSLNSRVVGGRRRRAVKEEKRQWTPVCYSSSSFAPLKLRAASFKGRLCCSLIRIICPGFSFISINSTTCMHSIKSKLLWETEGETKNEGEDSVLIFWICQVLTRMKKCQVLSNLLRKC